MKVWSKAGKEHRLQKLVEAKEERVGSLLAVMLASWRHDNRSAIYVYPLQ